MPELSEEEQAELERIREAFGDVSLEEQSAVTGEFTPINPMLADTLDKPLDSVSAEEWIAEPKYDGTRLLVERFEGETRAYSRRGVNRFEDIAAVHDDLEALPENVIIDGEYTFVTPKGGSSFHPIHTSAEKLRRKELTPVFYVFDILYDDADLTSEPLSERKTRLESVVEEGEHVLLTPYQSEGFANMYREQAEAGEEGLILKRVESQYYPGVRSEQWVKVKLFTERDAIVVGYTEGEGEREETFGSLVLSDGEKCIGRVGSGFTEDELDSFMEEFTPVDEQPFPESAVGMAYTPVEPFVITVKYQEITGDQKLRAPVFMHRNPEKPLEDVQLVS